MRFAFLLKVIPFAALVGFAPAAHAAGCDVDYVIQPGDTLQSISLLAYGSPSHQLISSANADKLVGQTELPVGESIVIPCIPGVASMTPNEVALSMAMLNFEEEAESASEDVADVETTGDEQATTENDTDTIEEVAPADAAEETEVEVAAAPASETVIEDPAPTEAAQSESVALEPAPAEPAAEPEPETVVATASQSTSPTLETVGGVSRMRLLTANGLAPFADQSLRGRGMATELAERAMSRLGILEASSIVFIDDRKAHLKDLLIDGSFDLGYPWFRPACEQMDKLEQLSPEEAWLCKNFTFTEPFYEFVYGFFVQKDEYSLSRTTFDDFVGARICRPAGSTILDLAINGLTDDETVFVRPDTLAECFAMLQAGDVDAVSGEAFEAENLLAELGLFETIEELPNLGLLQTVHAVAPIGKPGADDVVATMNKGLIELKISGEWFRIVGRHLAKN